MADTIFKKIIAGEIPSYKVYEDEHVIAFLDIHPIAKGHALVVPKQEAETVFDLDDAALTHLMAGVQKAMKRIQEVLQPDGFTVGWNHGKAGGQAIPQVHVHVLPRWHGDGGTSMHGVIDNPGDTPAAEVAKLFG